MLIEVRNGARGSKARDGGARVPKPQDLGTMAKGVKGTRGVVMIAVSKVIKEENLHVGWLAVRRRSGM